MFKYSSIRETTADSRQNKNLVNILLNKGDNSRQINILLGRQQQTDKNLVNILLNKGDNSRQRKSLLTYSSKRETTADLLTYFLIRETIAGLFTNSLIRETTADRYREVVKILLKKGDKSRQIKILLT